MTCPIPIPVSDLHRYIPIHACRIPDIKAASLKLLKVITEGLPQHSVEHRYWTAEKERLVTEKDSLQATRSRLLETLAGALEPSPCLP